MCGSLGSVGWVDILHHHGKAIPRLGGRTIDVGLRKDETEIRPHYPNCTSSELARTLAPPL
jgi:hypothetical protein